MFGSEIEPSMERVAFEEELHFEPWSKACSGRHDLDRYCSSPYWGVPLCKAFQGDGELFVYRSSSENFAVFCERPVQGGVLVLPADGMWLLGTPILSSRPASMLGDLIRYWAANPHPSGLRQILIGGVYPESRLIATRFWERLGGWELESSQRMVASLQGGFEGFMSRRSKNFRSRLRRTVKAAEKEGVEVDFMPGQADREACFQLMERVFEVEADCWKGQKGQGINTGGMRLFYEEMLPRLAAHGRLRGLFLRQEGQDVAYLFGALFDGYFRGLQFSYRSTHDAGLGNVCQYHMLQSLVEEGCSDYDLGQGMKYKTRWSEQHIESRSFVVQLS